MNIATIISKLVYLILLLLGFATFQHISKSSLLLEEEHYGFCGVVYSETYPRNYDDTHPINYSNEKDDPFVAIAEGKSLFKANCASCHAKNMKSDLTGPALGDVRQRWSAYPKEDLYDFIRNSQAMIHQGHPRTNELWDSWQPTVMNNFPNLSDEQIEAILAYTEARYYNY